MKKWSMILLAALCVMLPACGGAEGLPQLFEAVGEGLAQGMESGAQIAAQSMSDELALMLSLSSPRMEEGQRVTLTVTAENPRAQETAVGIDIRLPERLRLTGAAAWDAVLPPAAYDEETGALVPSVTTFTREIALAQGTQSEQVQIECEMSVGTRFYRAGAALDICMADVSVSAEAVGPQDGKLRPGGVMVYRVTIENAGMAAKDIAVELTLAEGMTLCGVLPDGFSADGGRIAGQARAEAAQAGKPGTVVLNVPVRISDDLLEGDADASKVIGGVLKIDGQREALPRVRVCAPQVSARLIPEDQSLRAGETMDMDILVVNTGLAAAQVELACLLPKGLTLAEAAAAGATDGEAQRKEEKKPGLLAAKNGGGPDQAVPAGAAAAAGGAAPQLREEDGEIVCTLHMDAAKETDAGVSAAMQVVTLRVRAQAGDDLPAEQMVGAALSWRTDGGEREIGEAVALRVYRAVFLGLDGAEWNAVFWATLLMVATMACLYAAVRSGKKEEYVFD